MLYLGLGTNAAEDKFATALLVVQEAALLPALLPALHSWGPAVSPSRHPQVAGAPSSGISQPRTAETHYCQTHVGFFDVISHFFIL